jgi:predicted nuclease with TOPRIM domain
MKRLLRRVGRLLGGPLPVYFDRRFMGLHEHLDTAVAASDRLRDELEERMTAMVLRVDGLNSRLENELHPLEELVTSLEHEVARLRQGLEPSR